MCLLTFPSLIWSVKTCGKPLLEPTPARFPKTKAVGCPLAGQHPSLCPPAGQVAPQWVALVWPGSYSPSQGEGLALGASAARTGIPVAVPASLSLTPFTSLLPFSLTIPSGLVHAGSTWSLCCPIAMLVLLSRNAAFHKHTLFARSTVLLEQGQETNPPSWEELSRRQEPLITCWSHADVIRSIRLGNKVLAWEQQ